MLVENEPKTKLETGSQTPTPIKGASGIEPGDLRQPPPSDPVAELYELLGPATVLLPVPGKQKHPSITGWNEVTFADTQKEYYKWQLDHCRNHAVLLGHPSGGLCSIDIDDDMAVGPFLDLNPALQQCLRTKGSRGCQIWVRMTGEYPKLTPLKTAAGEKWGEWRADGGASIVSGLHPEGMEYQRLVDAPPVEMSFDEIIWPENLVLPWQKSEGELLIEQEGAPFQLNDEGRITGRLNEMYFVEKYRREHAVLFDKQAEKFYEYSPEDGLWGVRRDLEIKAAMERDMKAMAKSFTDSSTQADLLRRREDKLFSQWVKSLKGRALRAGAFDQRPSAIHVRNGMLVLEDELATLEPFSPEFYSRNQIPFDYDANAECPRFLYQLLGSALEDDDISLLQRWCGAVLMGRNSAQRIMLITGTSGGGKSTLLSVIEAIIGPDNVAELRGNQIGERFEAAAFTGKSLLAAKDVSEKFMMQKGTHMLKSLVGNDRLEAEFKGGNGRVPYYGTFNVAITCNCDLNIKLEGDVDAWLRRLLVVNYEKLIATRRIPDFDKILIREEGSGILKWMVDGAIAHQRELADCGNFRLTEAQHQRVTDLLDRSVDSKKRFLEQKVVPFPGGSISSAELLAAIKAGGADGGDSDGKLLQVLPGLMEQIHGVSVVHNIKRDEATVRGYNGYALQQEAQQNAA